MIPQMEPWFGEEEANAVCTSTKIGFASTGSAPTSTNPKEELDALRMAAAHSGRSIAELIRDAIRKIVLKPQAAGPVAIWDGEPKRPSIEHDNVPDAR